jgi:TonB family protein
VSGGGNSATEFGWYGNMLHDRFYSAWIQPTTHVPTGVRISTLVKVRIEKDGRVSKFEIIKPSGNAVVNESVAAVAKQVTEVDSPPAGLIKGDHYDVKINFELNTEE